MVENKGQKESEATKCMETQQCKQIFKSENSQLEEFIIESSIVPQNSLGIIFKIDSRWQIHSTLSKLNSPSCHISIEAKVECQKKMWGVTGMIESLLETQVNL